MPRCSKASGQRVGRVWQGPEKQPANEAAVGTAFPPLLGGFLNLSYAPVGSRHPTPAFHPVAQSLIPITQSLREVWGPGKPVGTTEWADTGQTGWYPVCSWDPCGQACAPSMQGAVEDTSALWSLPSTQLASPKVLAVALAMAFPAPGERLNVFVPNTPGRMTQSILISKKKKKKNPRSLVSLAPNG